MLNRKLSTTLQKITNFCKKTGRAILYFLALSLILSLLAPFILPQSQLDKILRKTQIGSKLNLTQNSKIEIEGNSRITKQQIVDALEKISKKYGGIDFLESDLRISEVSFYKDLKAELPWAKQIALKRKLPDTLHVKIFEYEPFAIFVEEGKKYLIDRDGNKITTNYSESEFRNLIIVLGKNANLQAKSLVNILTIDPELSANIESATWIGDRRWNIKLTNGTLVKLPANNVDAAWKQLVSVYRANNLDSKFSLIDLRIEGKMYLK